MTSKPTWKQLLYLPTKITNKYVIAILAFLIWMTFFDKNNFFAQREYTNAIHELQEQKVFFDDGMLQLEQAYDDMIKHKTKFAREYHLMHKANEEVFVVRYVDSGS